MVRIDAIEPVTALKTKSAQIIRRARETARPVVITQNGRATAVLQDYVLSTRQVSARVERQLRALRRG